MSGESCACSVLDHSAFAFLNHLSMFDFDGAFPVEVGNTHSCMRPVSRAWFPSAVTASSGSWMTRFELVLVAWMVAVTG